MKKYILLAILCLGFAGGNAQARNTWNHGELLLQNGLLLTGELDYNWKAEIVQYRDGNTIKAYSAFQVKEFKYFDDRLNTLRKFVTMDYLVKKSVYKPLFMEEFGTGSLMIYRRLRHAREPITLTNAPTGGVDEKLIRNLNNFNYYIQEGKTITKLDDFFRESWPTIEQEFAEEIHRYHTSLVAGFTGNTLTKLLLISHYNQLKAQANWARQSKVAVQADAE
ncbi:hypothetical protein WBJ53_03155 [Spirosoma sp. SC4-14]|uniref:hypothetical protein n=1 Tax=Spirosoma sp. SC4-14 TaxID=3128900 RepID=UPI0030D4FA30